MNMQSMSDMELMVPIPTINDKPVIGSLLKNMSFLEDGSYFSTDYGKFEKKNKSIYWETGEISHINHGFYYAVKVSNGIHYSCWTKAHREKAKLEANSIEDISSLSCFTFED